MPGSRQHKHTQTILMQRWQSFCHIYIRNTQLIFRPLVRVSTLNCLLRSYNLWTKQINANTHTHTASLMRKWKSLHAAPNDNRDEIECCIYEKRTTVTRRHPLTYYPKCRVWCSMFISSFSFFFHVNSSTPKGKSNPVLVCPMANICKWPFSHCRLNVFNLIKFKASLSVFEIMIVMEITMSKHFPMKLCTKHDDFGTGYWLTFKQILNALWVMSSKRAYKSESTPIYSSRLWLEHHKTFGNAIQPKIFISILKTCNLLLKSRFSSKAFDSPSINLLLIIFLWIYSIFLSTLKVFQQNAKISFYRLKISTLPFDKWHFMQL